MSWIVALCLLATADLPHDGVLDRFEACASVAQEAGKRDFDPVLFVALAYEESRLDPTARSRHGARGPLQVLPRWHCPGGHEDGCDFVRAAGVSASRWRARFGDDWLCHYNAGMECGRRSRTFARRVERRAADWSFRLAVATEIGQPRIGKVGR